MSLECELRSNLPTQMTQQDPTDKAKLDTLVDLQRSLARALTHNSACAKSSTIPSDGALAGLDQVEIERSSETLIRKRLSQTRHMLPITTHTLSDKYPGLFRAFAADHHFDGHAAIIQDAVSFAHWLGSQGNVADWTAELARWEALQSSALLKRYTIKWLVTHFDFESWLQGERSQSPRRKTFLWLAIRVGNWQRVYCLP